MTTSNKAAPELRVTLNGKRLDDEITVVDFNPTLYTIASESDYSSLKAASGDLYVESEEREMVAEYITFTKYVDGQQYEIAEFDTPDFLLNTVVGIHELHYLDEEPAFLQGYELQDFYSIDILFIDDTGKAHYEDIWNFLIVEAADSYYLLEIGPNSQIEKILEERQITSRDDVVAYEISQDAYSALGELFIKP